MNPNPRTGKIKQTLSNQNMLHQKMKEHVYLVYLYVPGAAASASSTCTHQVKPLATRPLAFLRSRFSSAKITCFCPLQQMRVSSTIHQKSLILGPLELWIFLFFQLASLISWQCIWEALLNFTPILRC